MTARPTAKPIVAEIVRSGFVEGHHYGSVVAIDADGSPVLAIGDVTSPVLPRSCNKPLQALAMVRCGLDLHDELLALACASHSGEPFHLDGVRRILAGAGLDVFAEEPLPASSALWEQPNLLITPHSSAISREYLDLFIDEFLQRIEDAAE